MRYNNLLPCRKWEDATCEIGIHRNPYVPEKIILPFCWYRCYQVWIHSCTEANHGSASSMRVWDITKRCRRRLPSSFTSFRGTPNRNDIFEIRINEQPNITSAQEFDIYIVCSHVPHFLPGNKIPQTTTNRSLAQRCCNHQMLTMQLDLRSANQTILD